MSALKANNPWTAKEQKRLSNTFHFITEKTGIYKTLLQLFIIDWSQLRKNVSQGRGNPSLQTLVEKAKVLFKETFGHEATAGGAAPGR